MVRGVIRKVGDRCGFAAFYEFNCRFNPKTPGRMLQFLLTVTNPPSVKDVRLLPKVIEDWEAKRAALEREFGETLSEKLAAAIFTAMLLPNLQDMLVENQGTADLSYLVIRDEVMAVAGSRIKQSQPVPMDIGGVNGGAEVKCQLCGGADFWGAPGYTGDAGGTLMQVKAEEKVCNVTGVAVTGIWQKIVGCQCQRRVAGKAEEKVMEIKEKIRRKRL